MDFRLWFLYSNSFTVFIMQLICALHAPNRQQFSYNLGTRSVLDVSFLLFFLIFYLANGSEKKNGLIYRSHSLLLLLLLFREPFFFFFEIISVQYIGWKMKKQSARSASITLNVNVNLIHFRINVDEQLITIIAL